jgi:hypothetical protein
MDFVFRFVGLADEDQNRKWEGKKLILTVNEMRAKEGYEPHPDKLIGGAPLNPSLIGMYQQANQPQPADPGQVQDFGQPDENGAEAPSDQMGHNGGSPMDGNGQPRADGAAASGLQLRGLRRRLRRRWLLGAVGRHAGG